MFLLAIELAPLFKAYLERVRYWWDEAPSMTISRTSWKKLHSSFCFATKLLSYWAKVFLFSWGSNNFPRHRSNTNFWILLHNQLKLSSHFPWSSSYWLLPWALLLNKLLNLYLHGLSHLRVDYTLCPDGFCHCETNIYPIHSAKIWTTVCL